MEMRFIQMRVMHGDAFHIHACYAWRCVSCTGVLFMEMRFIHMCVLPGDAFHVHACYVRVDTYYACYTCTDILQDIEK